MEGISWAAALLVGAGYLIGSVSFAVVVSRARGVDIYRVGSGNPGTANVARSMGWWAAGVVLLGDAAKGAVAAGLGWAVAGSVAVGFAAGLAAVAGHCFPLWHLFRGGKGVATGGGVMMVLAPLVLLGLMVVWAVLARLTRVSSVGSLTAVVLAVPGLAIAGETGWPLVWVGLMALLIVARHHSNIARLVRGEEHGLGRDGEPA